MEWLLGTTALCTGLGLLSWRFKSTRTTHGSASWLTIFQAFRKGLFKKQGLLVGDFVGQLSVHYEGTHAITFGASGSSKGTSAILPNLLSYPWFFVVDPGGENTAVSIKWWRKRKIPVACINFFSLHTEEPWALPAQGFNPLDFLDVDSQAFAADALVFAEMLTPRHAGDGSSHYFTEASLHIKRALLVHIKTAEPKERQHLGTLYEYMHGSPNDWKALLAAMKGNQTCGGLVKQAVFRLERMARESPEEFSGVVSTIQQDLSFLADPLMQEKFSRSDVDFSILKGLNRGQRGGIISVILPLEYMETHAAIPRLALACAVLEMQRKPLAKSKVIFLIDEAATLGKLARLPNWLATLRKYRVVIWSIWQSMPQLVELYGRGWQTLISNCGLLQILGVADLETAEHTEKLLGKCTIETISTNGRGERSKSEAARPLLMDDEIRRLKADRQITFIGNLLPMKLRKTAYWNRPELAGRYYRNPYFDEDKGRDFGTGLRVLQGKVAYLLAWWLTPHPIAALLYVGCIAKLLL